MYKTTLFSSFLFVFCIPGKMLAQEVSYAENFTITDLDGHAHTLYDYLNAGQSVLLELMAPWCTPCIERHESAIFQGVYASRGPNSNPDDVVIFYIDTDLNTDDIELEQPVNFAGVEFPVCNLDDDEYSEFSIHYSQWLSAWPYALAILPDRSMREIAIESVTQVISELIVPKVNAGPDFVSSCYQPAIAASVSDADSSYITYSWIEILPDSSATSPPFPYYLLQPEVNETGVFLLGAQNMVNQAESSDIVVVTGVNKRAPLLYTNQDTVLAYCFGDTLDIFTNGLFGGGVWDRSWVTDDGIIVSLVDSTQHHIQVQGGGIYTTTTFDNLNGCQSVLDIVVVEPAVLKLDSVHVTAVSPGMTDGSISIFPSGGTGMLHATWNTGASGLTLNELPTGAYVCTITDENSCAMVLDTIYLQLFTGSRDILAEFNFEVHIFPNPVSDQLTITLPGAVDNCMVELFDLQGRLLLSRPFAGIYDHQLVMPLENIDQGLCIGRLFTPAGAYGYFRFLKI